MTGDAAGPQSQEDVQPHATSGFLEGTMVRLSFAKG